MGIPKEGSKRYYDHIVITITTATVDKAFPRRGMVDPDDFARFVSNYVKEVLRERGIIPGKVTITFS